MLFQPLPWDSAFFECRVTRLDIKDDCIVDSLKKELSKQGNYEFDVCYVFVYHNSTEITSYLQSLGAVLYDHKVTFKKDISKESIDNTETCVTEIKCLTQEAIDIAVSSGIHSRFYLDPHFRAKQPLLYKQWITNCFERNNGRVLGIVQDNVLTAIAGVSVSDRVGHLELIAVNPNYRRQGFAKRLIKTAEKFYLDSNVSTAEVVTQLNNTAACSTYQSCGYALIETVDVWHLWKNDLIAII